MKTTSFIILGILLRFSLFSQDTLYSVSGEKQGVKILEITSTEVKYKKTSNLDGPQYVINKSDVAAIAYGNGEREIYNGSSSNLPINVASNQDDPNINNPTVINNNNNYNQQQGYGVVNGFGVIPRIAVGIVSYGLGAYFRRGYNSGGYRGYYQPHYSNHAYGGGRNYGHYGRRH